MGVDTRRQHNVNIYAVKYISKKKPLLKFWWWSLNWDKKFSNFTCLLKRIILKYYVNKASFILVLSIKLQKDDFGRIYNVRSYRQSCTVLEQLFSFYSVFSQFNVNYHALLSPPSSGVLSCSRLLVFFVSKYIIKHCTKNMRWQRVSLAFLI